MTTKFQKWAMKQIDSGNEDKVKDIIIKKIKRIDGISQEKENLFSIDGTSYTINIK